MFWEILTVQLNIPQLSNETAVQMDTKWPIKMNNPLLNMQYKRNLFEDSDHNRQLKNNHQVLGAPQSTHSSKTHFFRQIRNFAL